MANLFDGIINQLANQILEEIKKAVEGVLQEFGDEVAEDLAQKAASDVYGAYSPEYYHRRHTLDNVGSYSVEVDKANMKVAITPIAEFNRAYGGWNYGNELGGFMNFGRGWHGYVMGNGWMLESGGGWNVPLPRPYISNYVDSAVPWDKLYEKLKAVLGEWIDVVDFDVSLGG